MKKQREGSVLKVLRLLSDSRPPSKSFSGDLGYDLYSAEDAVLQNGKIRAVSTGIAVEFPSGWGCFIKDRSSVAIKGVYTSAGVIDNGYRGEVKVIMRNESGEDFIIKRGDRVAQLVPVPVTDWQVEEADCNGLKTSDRQEGGFGSSGK